MVTVLLVVPKLMILAGFCIYKNDLVLMQGNTFLGKQSLLNVAHTLHIWNFRLNILPGWCALKSGTNFLDGVRIAAQSIDSGAARERLEALVAFSKNEMGQTQSLS